MLSSDISSDFKRVQNTTKNQLFINNLIENHGKMNFPEIQEQLSKVNFTPFDMPELYQNRFIASSITRFCFKKLPKISFNNKLG